MIRTEAAAPQSPREPTLAELARRLWRSMGGRGRVVAAAAASLVAVAVGVFVATSATAGGSFSYGGPAAPPFEISWDELRRVEPRGEELLRLRRGEADRFDELLTVAPLDSVGPGEAVTDSAAPSGTVRDSTAPSGTGGDSAAVARLALSAQSAARAIRARYPGAEIVLEGGTRVFVESGTEAYQLAFRAPAGERAVLLGKLLLIPDPDRRGEGVAIELVERTAKQAVVERSLRAPASFFANWPVQILLEDAASVRTAESFEEPLRSFRFL